MIRILLVLILMTGCSSSIEPLQPNPSEITQANTFIGDLTECKVRADWVVQGSVTTSDEKGNFYQSLYIEEATGCLELRFSFYDSFKMFHQGDIISVNLFDYEIYSENNQLYVNMGNLEMVSQKVLRQGLQDPIIPRLTEISEIDSTMTGRLIEIRDGEFNNGGKENWNGEQRYTKRKKSIIVYTSALASYANELLPFGTFNIVGIVTLYNGKFQIKMSAPSQK